MTAARDTPPPRGAFGEGNDRSPRRVPIRSEPAPKGTYATSEDELREPLEGELWGLTVPPDERPSQSNLPGNIEEAVLQALEQVPRRASAPPPPPGSQPPPPPRKVVRPR